MDFSFLLCSTQNDRGRFDACDLGRCGVDTEEKYKRPDNGECGVGITCERQCTRSLAKCVKCQELVGTL
eukprot:2444261-Rhodomonas_salina.1